jgi:hypothetical protein
MKKIDGTPKTIRELFTGVKYTIHYYQREYQLAIHKNRSLNDLTFDKKLPIYFGENLLAKSLNNDCYQNNPQFKRFFEAENLQFKSYATFDKTALLERQELYEELAKKIWGISRLDEQLN